jgi:hypothetical protein
MDALTSDLELRRLRTELAEKQFALENTKGEWDRWRTIAEGRSLVGRRAESAFTRNASREWWWRLNDGSGRPTDIP